MAGEHYASETLPDMVEVDRARCLGAVLTVSEVVPWLDSISHKIDHKRCWRVYFMEWNSREE